MFQMEIVNLSIVPIVIGLLEVLKKAIKINNRFLPAISLIVAIVINLAVVGAFSVQSVLGGVLIGLSASGLYDNGRSVVNK